MVQKIFCALFHSQKQAWNRHGITAGWQAHNNRGMRNADRFKNLWKWWKRQYSEDKSAEIGLFLLIQMRILINLSEQRFLAVRRNRRNIFPAPPFKKINQIKRRCWWILIANGEVIADSFLVHKINIFTKKIYIHRFASSETCVTDMSWQTCFITHKQRQTQQDDIFSSNYAVPD